MTDYLISNPNAPWPAQIKEIEVGDPVLGGPDGTVNIPHQKLTDRTEYLKTTFTIHVNATSGVHGATSAPTANKLIIRDGSGRAQVSAPSAANDIVNLAYPC